jgi:hypothetical protein
MANPIIFIVLFLVLAVGGGAVWYFMAGPGKGEEKDDAVTTPTTTGTAATAAAAAKAKADAAAKAKTDAAAKAKTPTPSSFYKSDPSKYGDIYGFDVSSPAKFKDKTTVDDCAQACTDTPDCKAFMYNTSTPSKPFCLGKTTNDLNRSYLQKDALLYYKPPGPPSSYYKSEPAKYGDIYGFDVSSPAKFTGKANLDDCAQACTDTPDCKAFVIDTADPAKPSCWGKTINDLAKSYPLKDRALYYNVR